MTKILLPVFKRPEIYVQFLIDQKIWFEIIVNRPKYNVQHFNDGKIRMFRFEITKNLSQIFKDQKCMANF